MFFGVALLGVAEIAFAQSTRPGWGATPYRDALGTGVTFRVWAPNALTVTVPGQFNNWNTTANPLLKEGTNGVWSADIASANAGQEYKYLINGNIWKRDPRSRRVVNSAGNSIIYDPAAFNWDGDNFTPPALNDLVIYEMHVGTFYDRNPGDSLPGTFNDATNRLDYLRQLGINAVELMPIAEFPGNRSWGYNPSDLFAVENTAYGGPDGFKNFVKAAHARGIAVLLDVVHNHYGPSDLDLWNFDGFTGGGNGGGIYFYQSNGICCTIWGPRPNFMRPETRAFIQDNFRMWLDEYRVDGFRWDTPGVMMWADGYGTVTDAVSLIQQINAMIKSNYAGKINISEDVMGMGFDSAWDTVYPFAINDQLTPTNDSNRNVSGIASAILNNMKFGGAAELNRVVFTESHDTTGNLNGGVRLPTAIDSATPGSYRARKLSTLGAAIAFTSPGIPMIFQGQEMLENLQFSDTRPVDWSKTNTYSSVVRWYRDLIRARRNLDGLTPGLRGEQCAMLNVDNVNKLLAFRRWNNITPTQDVVVIANLTATAKTNFTVQMPRVGEWFVHLNSDSAAYGTDYSDIGSPLVTATGNPASANITIGPYSVLVLSQISGPELAAAHGNGVTTVAWPKSFGAWLLETNSILSGTWGQISQSEYQTNATEVFVNINPAFDGAFFRLRRP